MLFSRRLRRLRRGMQQELHYFAEKDRLFEAVAVIAVFVVWVLSAIICVICERHWGFVCANRLSPLA